MSGRNLFIRWFGISLVAAFILASCNAAGAPPADATLTATRAPLAPTPTLTPVPTLTGTALPVPTATATEPPTPTLQLTPQVNPGMNAYCRKGPGTDYFAITFLQAGTSYNVIGQDGTNTWWLVQASGNVTCWVGDPTSVMQGPVWQVSVVMVPPLPQASSSFAATYTCDPKNHSLKVAFDWAPVRNVTGYRIYQNGNLLVELGPTNKAYQDNSAPLAVDLVYKLVTFNDYGVSPGVSATVTSCGD